MRDAAGGAPAIAFILFFIAAVSGYIAFTINYSKAFKVKSKLIDEIEAVANKSINNKNFNLNDILKNSDFRKATKSVTDDLSYNANDTYTTTCATSGYKEVVSGQGWCYSVVDAAGPNGVTSQYVKVKTFVVIDVPVFNRIFSNLRLFHVEGSTKTFRAIKR